MTSLTLTTPSRRSSANSILPTYHIYSSTLVRPQFTISLVISITIFITSGLVAAAITSNTRLNMGSVSSWCPS